MVNQAFGGSKAPFWWCSNGWFGGYEVGTGGWLLALHPWSWWWPEKQIFDGSWGNKEDCMSDSSRLHLKFDAFEICYHIPVFPLYNMCLPLFTSRRWDSNGIHHGSWMLKCSLHNCSTSPFHPSPASPGRSLVGFGSSCWTWPGGFPTIWWKEWWRQVQSVMVPNKTQSDIWWYLHTWAYLNNSGTSIPSINCGVALPSIKATH